MAFNGVMTGPLTLAPSGSTGNNTHTGIFSPSAEDTFAVVLKAEAVGATPTITWKVQGSFTGGSNAGEWQDIQLLPTNTDTSAGTITLASPVANDTSFAHCSLASSRFFRYYRLVTSANTNVTYRADIYFG